MSRKHQTQVRWEHFTVDSMSHARAEMKKGAIFVGMQRSYPYPPDPWGTRMVVEEIMLRRPVQVHA